MFPPAPGRTLELKASRFCRGGGAMADNTASSSLEVKTEEEVSDAMAWLSLAVVPTADGSQPEAAPAGEGVKRSGEEAMLAPCHREEAKVRKTMADELTIVHRTSNNRPDGLDLHEWKAGVTQCSRDGWRMQKVLWSPIESWRSKLVWVHPRATAGDLKSYMEDDSGFLGRHCCMMGQESQQKLDWHERVAGSRESGDYRLMEPLVLMPTLPRLACGVGRVFCAVIHITVFSLCQFLVLLKYIIAARTASVCS